MLRTRLILCIIGFFSSTVLMAQVKLTLKGMVINSISNESLAGATIYIPDMRKGAIADSAGRFTITNISPGKHLIEISHTGFVSFLETIDFSADLEREFLLQPSIVESENITVTGVSSATSVKRTPVPVNIIRRENLFLNNSTNLIDNISRVPGVSQVTTGPAVSKPFIRGLGYNRVVVISDGIRQEGQQWGDEHGVEIDEQNVSKIEILKGPASLMYGSDALAGVVNVISIAPVPEGRIKGNLSAGYFTNNRQRNLHADIGGNQKGFGWGLSGSYKAAADYRNKFDGYVFNSKFNERNLGAYLGLNKTWGFSHWYASFFDQSIGMVEGERDNITGEFLKLINDNGVESETIASAEDFRSIDPFIPKQEVRHVKFASDNSIRINKNRLTFLLAYQRNQRKEFGNVLDPSEQSLYFDLHTLNCNLQYHLEEKKNVKLSFGLNGMQQSNLNKGFELLIPEYDLFDIGAFIYGQRRWEKLTLSGGLRFDNRSLQSDEFIEGGIPKFIALDKKFANISGSIGLAWQQSKWVNLKLNIARGFRAPTIAELSSNGAHEGTNRFEYGEPNLRSETSLQIDAGIEAASEHVSFTASVFYNAMQDFIFYRKLRSVSGGDSLITNGSETFFAFRFSQDNARLFGVEFNLDIHPHPLDWLHFENTFSWVRGKLNIEQDGSHNLPFIPAARLINELKVELLRKGERFRNLFFNIEFDNNFSQNNPFTGYNTETATPGYTLINAGAGVELKKKEKTVLSLFMGVSNIADIGWQNHLSRLKYAPVNNATGRQGVLGMGRNFSIKLNIPIDFVVRNKISETRD